MVRLVQQAVRQLAGVAGVFGYLVALTIIVQATIAQARASRPRPSNQVSLVILLRIMALTAVVAAVIAALLHQFVSVALWLGACLVVAALGELVWRLRWGQSTGARRS